jgi:hypothetical protein
VAAAVAVCRLLAGRAALRRLDHTQPQTGVRQVTQVNLGVRAALGRQAKFCFAAAMAETMTQVATVVRAGRLRAAAAAAGSSLLPEALPAVVVRRALRCAAAVAVVDTLMPLLMRRLWPPP